MAEPGAALAGCAEAREGMGVAGFGCRPGCGNDLDSFWRPCEGHFPDETELRYP